MGRVLGLFIFDVILPGCIVIAMYNIIGFYGLILLILVRFLIGIFKSLYIRPPSGRLIGLGSNSDYSQLFGMVDEISNEFDIYCPELIVSEQSSIAEVHDSIINGPYIRVNPSILQLDVELQRAIIAHEFSHILQGAYKFPLYRSIFDCLALIVSIVGLFILGLPGFVVLVFVAWVLKMLVEQGFYRIVEYRADIIALEVVDSSTLAHALSSVQSSDSLPRKYEIFSPHPNLGKRMENINNK